MRWTWFKDAVYSSPAVSGGLVYFGSEDGRIHAVDKHNGEVVWSHATGLGEVSSSPAVANGVVYVGGDRRMLALDARTGALLWSYRTGGEVESSPAVAGGKVFVGSDDGRIHAFALAPSAR